jgi:DNA-binding MarR family transcriptional regulator
MTNQHDQQERERIAQLGAVCICSNLRRTTRIVTNYYDSLLAQVDGLRVSQAIVLVVLYLAGPQTIHALADMMALDRTTIGRNLRPLTQQGLLALESGQDKRTRVITLTPKGKETLMRVVPLWEQAQAHMVAEMEHDQLSSFLSQLSAVEARTREA